MAIAKKRIYLNMITKNIWLLIGALTVLCAGVVGVNAYLSKKTAPVTETPEEIVEESTVAEPEEPTSTVPEEISLSSEIDTSDWETYRNKEYGFEIKYPDNWKVLKVYANGIQFDPDQDTRLIAPSGSQIEDVCIEAYHLTDFLKQKSSISQGKNFASFESWIDWHIQNNYFSEKNTATVGSYSGVEVLEFMPKPYFKKVFLSNEAFIYQISLPEFYKERQLYIDVLSTLKFSNY